VISKQAFLIKHVPIMSYNTYSYNNYPWNRYPYVNVHYLFSRSRYA